MSALSAVHGAVSLPYGQPARDLNFGYRLAGNRSLPRSRMRGTNARRSASTQSGQACSCSGARLIDRGEIDRA
jgi:hypothetical protein